MTGLVMTIKTQCFSLILAALFAAHAVAQSEPVDIWMTQSDLKQTFSGKTIAGVYPSGRGFIETFNVGGRILYRDEQRHVSGRWTVNQRAFCTIYDGDATGGCYLVRRMGENCYEFYFISRTVNANRKPEDLTWTAQAWLSEKPSTCVAGAEV